MEKVGEDCLLLLGKTKSFVFPSRRRTDEINESLNGPFQANRSDGIKSEIGIERKKIKPRYKLIECIFLRQKGYKAKR